MASAVHGGIGYFGLWLSTSHLLEMNKRIDTSMVLFTFCRFCAICSPLPNQFSQVSFECIAPTNVPFTTESSLINPSLAKSHLVAEVLFISVLSQEPVLVIAVSCIQTI
jgi:hypothetical protein